MSDEFNEALQAGDEAIAGFFAAAPTAWKTLAYLAGVEVAKQRRQLTSEHIRDYLDMHNIPEPPEPRALGAIMKQLAADNIIENTNSFTRYTRRSRHTGITYVWQSKIYKEATTKGVS